MLSASEANGLARALDLAATPGVPPGPNPRVGCVILDAQGSVVGEGYHRGAGTPHAEVDALARAGDRARGATAVVTLEPCDHHGRTPPCTDALIAAGIERVVYAMPDPSETAGGGAARLAAEGLDVVLVDSDQGRRAREFLAPWAFAVVHGRPFVTLKMAATLDGRVAAADGTSRWISGEESRRQVHRLRADVDAVVIGSETAIADDPELSVRLVDSAGYQPLRVVMGLRAVPMGSHLATSGSVHLRTRDPLAALDDLYARGVRHVLLEERLRIVIKPEEVPGTAADVVHPHTAVGPGIKLEDETRDGGRDLGELLPALDEVPAGIGNLLDPLLELQLPPLSVGDVVQHHKDTALAAVPLWHR